MIPVISAVLFLLALMRLPIFVVLLAASILGFYAQDIPFSIIAAEIYRLTDTPLLVALPLFSLAGYLLAQSGTPNRLVQITATLFGWMPSGLPIVCFFICAFFTALTGASGVTIVAIGALLYPALLKGGYRKPFSLGLVTTSGSLGLLLVPSMPLILYGVIVQQMGLSVRFEMNDLFWAGILPASLMIGLLSAYSIWANRKHKVAQDRFTPRSIKRVLWDARWDLPLPFVVLGSIYSGLLAISEVAAMTAAYVVFVQLCLYREIPLKALPSIVKDSAIMVGEILLILAVSLALSNVIIDAEIPSRLFDVTQQFIDSKYTFLLVLNLFLLALGMLLDVFSALMIIVPLIVPVALSYGIHPVHLGIVFLANMQIGYFTPPVGMNLFIASYRFKEPITVLYQSTLPFFLVMLASVLIITYVPFLSLAFID
ncbi:TRAP transporter large permease subunit [Aestuariibacter sp. AA17]|uniref:TRAP transporter large permease protein n=1 Tax=Fluctibacter corallii TaxID=2984329 RepID=A0ABT3A571_9ALTE|nr:TRAP transporter large permease subunit [Aestuariibacter sp. AA17]MCV2883814.1 TRAP transporter large permease subunit [Aestuariibacter sp. AA17]